MHMFELEVLVGGVARALAVSKYRGTRVWGRRGWVTRNVLVLHIVAWIHVFHAYHALSRGGAVASCAS